MGAAPPLFYFRQTPCCSPKRRPAQESASTVQKSPKGNRASLDLLLSAVPRPAFHFAFLDRFSNAPSDSGTACFRCRVPCAARFSCGTFPARCVFHAERSLRDRPSKRAPLFSRGDDMRREILHDRPKIAFAGVRLQIDLRRHTLKPHSVGTGDEVGHDRSVHCRNLAFPCGKRPDIHEATRPNDQWI